MYYKDLWLSKSVRDQMVGYRIVPENLRKLTSKDDRGASSGNADKVADALMLSIQGTKLRVKLDKILEDNGLYAPFEMYNNSATSLRYQGRGTLWWPSQVSLLMGTHWKTSNWSTDETVDNPEIASETTSLYTVGRSLSYEHVALMKSTEWAAGSTLIHEHAH